MTPFVFGPVVTTEVVITLEPDEGCSDSFDVNNNKKPNWETRKRSYIERLPNESQDTLLVSAADKLYNARTMLEDYRNIGAEVWKRFKRGRREQLWYFNELLKVYGEKWPNWRLVQELKRVVAELTQLSEAPVPRNPAA